MAVSKQAYPGLERLDPALRQSLIFLWDRIHALEGRTGDPTKFRGDIDLGGFSLRHMADAVANTDGLSLGAGLARFGPSVMQDELAASGSAPLNVNGLMGLLGEAQTMGITVIPDTQTTLPDPTTSIPFQVITWRGALYYLNTATNPPTWAILATGAITQNTHANRLTTFLPANYVDGTLYYETDRTTLFAVRTVATVKYWYYLAGVMRGTSIAPDTRPTDLTASADVGFRFQSTETHETFYWNGATWTLVSRRYPWRCQITLSGDQSVPDATPTLASFDTEWWNYTGMFAIGSPTKISIPTGAQAQPELWLVVAQAKWASNGVGRRDLEILYNGVQVAVTRQAALTTGEHGAQAVATIGGTSAGDYVEMQVTQTSGGALALKASTTWLSVVQIA